MFKKVKNFIKSGSAKVMNAFASKKAAVSVAAHDVLDGTVAEAYVDTGVKILIAVVVGALLLGGLYALFGDTIMPTVTEKVEELFDYAG